MERLKTLLTRPGCWLWCSIAAFVFITAIDPHERLTWLLEVSWVLLGLAFIAVWAWRGGRMTPWLAWGLWAHALLLVYGGWYTYAETPFGFWLGDSFGWERNHYDRIGHFMQGFAPALLYREVYVRVAAARRGFWLEWFVFVSCMAFTALFELLEFGVAKAIAEDATAYLAIQGSPWDAQWDMFWCGVGALASQLCCARLHQRSIVELQSHG